MEIRRFGIGHRRLDGPPGTRGVEATSLHVDERGLVAELALKPHAAIAPHTNPSLAYLLVIEGGGFVRVGSETARVAAGEAVVWPPNVAHAAWTELTPMRAIVVEFAPAAEAEGRAAELIDPSPARSIEPATGSAPDRADGGLAPRPAALPPDRQSPEEEPW
jgi:quercetin dioxygenase-like cupin family protein